MQPGPPPLRDQILQAGQDGDDELHVVAGVWLLQDLQRCSGVSVHDHHCLWATLGVLEGVKDGHQLSLEGGAVV